LIVQANIGNLEKQYAEKGWGFRTHIMSRYFDLSLQGIQNFDQGKIDFMIWPETAFPDQIGEGFIMNPNKCVFVNNHNVTI